jgi:hypothetical protein
MWPAGQSRAETPSVTATSVSNVTVCINASALSTSPSV